jgi:hypothetical protein
MLKNLFKWNDLWAMLALSAWFLMYHLPVTLAQRVFSEGDILWGNLPIRAEVTRALMLGKLPLWTPLLQGGMPLFAEGHTAALYPLNPLLHFFLAPHFAISYIILFNLGWVALGMYAFARALGLRVSSSILAGLTFGASGALIARVSHLDVHTPISWLPWLMFFQVRYWRARGGTTRARLVRAWLSFNRCAISRRVARGDRAQLDRVRRVRFVRKRVVARIPHGEPHRIFQNVVAPLGRNVARYFRIGHPGHRYRRGTIASDR